MNNHDSTPPRYELKLPLHGVDITTVINWVRLHPAHWHESYPPRQVNNIYFDSFDLRALRANLDGLSDRDKLRLRWYGPSIETIENPNFELKRRRGNVGWKDSVSLEGSYCLDAPVIWSDLCRTLFTNLPPSAKHWVITHPRAVMVSHYQRAYYETFNRELRLTLDTELRTYPQGGESCPNFTRSVPIEHTGVVVLELKAAPESAALLSDVVAAFPVSSQRFSKYVQGLAAAWGLKSEEFV